MIKLTRYSEWNMKSNIQMEKDTQRITYFACFSFSLNITNKCTDWKSMLLPIVKVFSVLFNVIKKMWFPRIDVFKVLLNIFSKKIWIPIINVFKVLLHLLIRKYVIPNHRCFQCTTLWYNGTVFKTHKHVG